MLFFFSLSLSLFFKCALFILFYFILFYFILFFQKRNKPNSSIFFITLTIGYVIGKTSLMDHLGPWLTRHCGWEMDSAAVWQQRANGVRGMSNLNCFVRFVVLIGVEMGCAAVWQQRADGVRGIVS